MVVADAGDVEGSNCREGDVSGAVDGETALLVYLTEELDAEFVARADDVVGGDGDIVERGEGIGNTIKEIGSEDGECGAGRLCDEPLELRWSLGNGGSGRVPWPGRIRWPGGGVC